MGAHRCAGLALVVGPGYGRLRQAACRGAAALLLAVLVWQPAVASERSQQLVAEARQLMRATPPRIAEVTLKLRAATEADPTDAQAWLVRGAYALKQQSYADALLALDRAVALDRNIANLQFLRGSTLAGLARYDEAIAAYDQEVNKDGIPSYWFYRGLASEGARRYAAALSDFDNSDRIFPAGRQQTELHRGDIYVAQGKLTQDETAYATAIALD